MTNIESIGTFSVYHRITEDNPIEYKIRIKNEDIVKVSETKFLGIYIDFRLNWKKHIQNISNKVSKGIAIIYRASRVLNETALMLYNT